MKLWWTLTLRVYSLTFTSPNALFYQERAVVQKVILNTIYMENVG